MNTRTFLCLFLLFTMTLPAAAQALTARIDRRAADIEEQVIAWRRDIHQHPELGNREFRTAGVVADHLRSLGMEVRTEVAHTGVVGVLQGGKPGPVVALRADMDALPVTEMVDLPFASKEKTIYNGREVGVMHACGHDNHVAILMGVADVLASMREDLPGSVVFVFQPAEEGAPAGEEGGADLMLREGAFEDPKPEAVFGLHVFPGRVGTISYRPGGAMASSDGLRIVVKGRQTHGAIPWGGVDPIVVASQIVLGLQTVASRQLDVTATPSIITIGSIHGGVRGNIIPDEVVMTGTIRTFDTEVQKDIHRRIRHTAERIAESAGATAEVRIGIGYPVTINNPDLTARMLPTLRRVAGDDNVLLRPPTTGAEDFSYFAQQAPGLYVFLGVTPEDQDPETVPRNHSPLFFADEGALITGVRALAHLAVDYMTR
ncbi:MAG: amidohydrolase [Rhodothermales bacterium]